MWGGSTLGHEYVWCRGRAFVVTAHLRGSCLTFELYNRVSLFKVSSARSRLALKNYRRCGLFELGRVFKHIGFSVHDNLS